MGSTPHPPHLRAMEQRHDAGAFAPIRRRHPPIVTVYMSASFWQCSAFSMTLANSKWPISSILLILFGASLLAVGAYFVALRPPLLPEDLRYMGASQAQFEAIAPRLTVWLTQVFRVLGGYISATGILTIALAATSYRSHDRGVGAAAAAAGLASIGLMASVNFAINSDFKWALLSLAILWACSLLAFCAETLRISTDG